MFPQLNCLLTLSRPFLGLAHYQESVQWVTNRRQTATTKCGQKRRAFDW